MATRVTKSKSAKKSASKTSASRPKPSVRAAATTRAPKKPPASVSAFPAALALYVYGVTQIPAAPLVLDSEAVDGKNAVEPIPHGDYLCWASRVSRKEFADELQKNMEDLEWLAACSIRHQKVLAEIGLKLDVLPARFGTVFLNPQSLTADLKSRAPGLKAIFRKIAGADEWGVKVFAVPQAKSATPAISAKSGSDYLKQKATSLKAATSKRDEASIKLGEDLERVSQSAMSGGKASSGQPGLVWSGSFLVKRTGMKAFEDVLRRFARQWAGQRRIDVSGPWPPYSFVNP